MIKVVINTRHGGFGLSRQAVEWVRAQSGDPLWGGPTLVGDVYPDGSVVDRDFGHCDDVSRDDPWLVRAVEILGEAASGRLASLKIVLVPDNVKWLIAEYDGSEWVAEVHRTWN